MGEGRISVSSPKEMVASHIIKSFGKGLETLLQRELTVFPLPGKKFSAIYPCNEILGAFFLRWPCSHSPVCMACADGLPALLAAVGQSNEHGRENCSLQLDSLGNISGLSFTLEAAWQTLG